MADLAKIINSVYGSPETADQVLKAAAGTGHDIREVTPGMLSSMDELHAMGREATLRLGKLAGFDDDTSVLDIGCGIGGAARTIAHAFGSRVTGIDLTEEFCRAATELSRAVGISELVEFRHGNALDLPFEAASFDGAVMIHMNMNIPDKATLFSEAARVLKPSGTLAMWEVCKGDDPGELVFPVPWSDDASSSFLVSHDEMNGLLETAGFSLERTENALAEIRAWSAAQGEAEARNRVPGLEVVIKNFPEKQKNAVENAMNGRLSVIRVIARKN